MIYTRDELRATLPNFISMQPIIFIEVIKTISVRVTKRDKWFVNNVITAIWVTAVTDFVIYVTLPQATINNTGQFYDFHLSRAGHKPRFTI